ncbi:MAG: acyltransferase [Oscillospiraceae bacterium]|nr:acyltransferase [Oscillospiraceae bacterium]
MKQKQLCSALTVMSGIAILFVLGIHGCSSALARFYPGTTGYAQTGIWLRAFSNLVAPAVPMFLFVSGYKYALNDADTHYPTFLKKRLLRVIISFAVINTFFWLLDSIKYMESLDPVLLLKTYLHSWMGYSVAYQLWYVPMYCFVLILCPLVRRIIPSAGLRFLLYAVVGITQRVLEAGIPVLAAYPIRFISYPVFFEMGVLACETNWRNRISGTASAAAGAAYILAVILLAWKLPAIAADGLTKYIVYYFAGTAVFFAVSIQWKANRFLQWMGAISYPLFLLHEPVIGKMAGKVLSHLPLGEITFALCWLILDFVLTWLVIEIFKRLKLDKILWNFHINEKK